MSSEKINNQEYFRLRAIKSAKVSEISEATAASPVAPNQRMNFHIGHPVQDERLYRRYYQLVSDPAAQSAGNDEDSDESAEQFNAFLKKLVRQTAPYMPRGGYLRTAPHPLLSHLNQWLTKGQQEPLTYELGEHSPQRECMLATGGSWESLRILLHSLSHYLVHLPAVIFLHKIIIPVHLQAFSNMHFISSDGDETEVIQILMSHFDDHPQQPVFMIIGAIQSETLRRQLRILSLSHPVYFIEMNSAANHLSLAREAKMKRRILRILPAAILDRRFQNMAVEFVLGDAELIRVMETVQFELKGTPSASEIDLLAFLQDNPSNKTATAEFDASQPAQITNPRQREDIFFQHGENLGKSLENHIERIDKISTIVGSSVLHIDRVSRNINRKLTHFPGFQPDTSGSLTGQSTTEIMDAFVNHLTDTNWLSAIQDNFTQAFIKQHPEYAGDYCLPCSGSARTALSLIGFHGGIDQVITSDLGWTYEHCFPKVETVPLSDTLVLDANALITAVEEKLRMDPGWINHGAVVVNNPHNASGHVAPAAEIERLLIFLLEHGVYVIDDLSYQNVLPRPSLDGPFTLRETAADLVRKGYLSPDRLRYLITVHSLSKTDCFAGARLAVIVVSDLNLYQRFDKLVSTITPNYMALLLAYLFYRNHTSDVRNYWLLRNRIFSERMQALEKAVNDLPVERNPFAIEIHPPMGSMYPRLVINKLPNGLSLDWLSSNLAARGIGLVPLSTFARTAIGFRVARKSFRLTLGGSDGSAILARKMRRLVIDLNHLVANEETKYNLKTISGKHTYPQLSPEIKFQWNVFSQKIKNSAPNIIKEYRRDFPLPVNRTDDFLKEFIPFRVSGFYQQLKDRFQQDYETGRFAISRQIIPTLERELFKDDLHSRTERFRKRLFDRTVHPTQIYSLKTDLAYQPIIENILSGQAPTADAIKQISKSLAEEYLGKNIALNSMDEADELIFDLRSMIAAEKFVDWHSTESIPALLSFWGDWDGSNRPSGQGHRLVAAALLENVSQLTNLLHLLKKYQPDIPVDPSLQKEMNQFPVNREKFWDLLNEITRLTNQLEKRYQGFIPLELSYGKFKKAAIRLHLSKDPLTALWQHNDRLEKRMYKMRQDRRTSLEYYFSLNKRIRKSLHQFLPQIEKQLHHAEVARAFGGYRDILKRFVLTPRIHQRIITSEDPFTVDTTAHNITEINEISGKYGNPGMVMALQVSMSTRPEALITLDRKLRAQREEILRHSIASELPPIWIIPLFEEIQPINDLTVYLDRIWSYAGSSRRIDQSREDRFSELVCEIFIAGSDLSQQVGQPAAASVYKNAKYTTLQWLAVRGLVDKVRMKFGSGEAMQRQGGFYNMDSEQPLFLRTRENKKRMENLLKRSTLESTRYAKSPLRGVLTSGDLRTFQSTISEKLRFLPLEERANLFYHLTSAQKFHDDELIRISEPFLDTRFQFQERGRQEMSSFIYGNVDPEYQKFLELHTSNFRQIIYGREEDVVGIHVISHFVSRALPELRDRPTVRPSRDMGAARGQKIIERVAQTLPLSKHGSMLRAIGHNRAQTMVLGVNQLTTGLFRAFSEFSNQQSGENDATSLLSSRILPQLPVQEILESLFYYHDPTLKYVDRLEKAFPAGNSAFLYLKEDVDSITAFVGLLQKELLRRAGMDISDFFNGNEFNPQLLPTVRPGIAILLQANLFNTDAGQFFKGVEQPVDPNWKNEVSRLLQIPQKIAFWREQIWQAVEQPIFGQVKSFVELAQAIYTIAHSEVQSKQAPTKNISEVVRVGGHVARLLRSTGDDSMRQFLTDVVQLLTQIPFTMTEIPVDIIRALRDVEKIVQIEEQVLSGKEQEQVRFYLTQMARLTGENG